MSVELVIQLNEKALLNGRVLVLSPYWVFAAEGVAEGLVYSQIAYLAKAPVNDDNEFARTRISYSKLQKQFPFYTKRWLIKVVKKLEQIKAITVVRNGRVNEYILDAEPTNVIADKVPQGMYSSMLVFPELACKVGLLEAIALQQIHIRHHECDGSIWVIRTLEQWHTEIFMFLGIATVKRLFARLQRESLILVKPYKSETGYINSYRVNYKMVAEVLGVPIPVALNPYEGNTGYWEPKPSDWTDPINPLEGSSGNADSHRKKYVADELHMNS